MIRKWLPLLVGLVTLFGCDNDDDPKSNKVLRFSAPDDFQQEESYWIVISDAGGNVLDTKQLHGMSTYTFGFPSNLTTESVTMTLVRNFTFGELGSTTFVTTYTDVRPGDYHFPDYNNTSGYRNTAYLTLPGFRTEDDRFDWIFPGGLTVEDVEGPEPASEARVWYEGDKSGFLLMSKERPYRYQYTELFKDFPHYTLNPDYLEFCSHRTIGRPAGDISYLRVTGINPYGEFPYYFTQDQQILAGTSLEVPVMPPSVFNSYALAFLLKNTQTGKMYGASWRYSELPAELPVLESNVENFAVGVNSVHWETSATQALDAVSIVASTSSDDNSVSWEINGASGKQRVVIPDIPDQVPMSGIRDQEALRKFTTLAHENGAQVTLIASQDFNGYWEYILKEALQKTEFTTRYCLTMTQFVTP
ncbi:hypothetical protein KK062_26510 [Fulvivirgaceae bacterium PWU5]|uniref:Uncharacterized protein n=1 Tax=Dawidia cretensis TaxID=2782350 RepID=A0AAP2GWZ8_9BACT|nr:hypothetical protein [Dawidia cretensis]MBT1711822.1 hypothetical protein [Dawidia cretensis]